VTSIDAGANHWDEIVIGWDESGVDPAGARPPPSNVGLMKLADRIAQFRTPFVVQCASTGGVQTLNNVADCARAVTAAPIRFVLSDDLTRLCTALAYSKGAKTLACTDLIRIPAESLWIEWCCRPWQHELSLHGFSAGDGAPAASHRRGVFVQACADGRRGALRTFWSEPSEREVLASSVEAYFDLDTPPDEEPEPWPGRSVSTLRVCDREQCGDDILSRCFRFHYESSWADYYRRAALSADQRAALWRHALGTIALDIPVLLAFLVLLGTRGGLPQSPQCFERLNRLRRKAGKPPLLEHIDVRSPLLPDLPSGGGAEHGHGRRSPRLHHVRGHLVRRGSDLFWRVPHLRGSARQGAVRSRTVTWTLDPR
jgi:hypothetical protein